MNDKIKVILEELKFRFERLYGERLVQMVLYGSQARGDAKFGSDIDVLVVLKGPVNIGEEIKITSYISAELSLENDEVISCVFMDENEFSQRLSPLLRNVRKEGMAI